MDIKSYLEKLRGLSDTKKKIILWGTVAVAGLILGIFWVRGAMNTVSKISKQIPSIDIPSVNIPATDILQTTSPNKN